MIVQTTTFFHNARRNREYKFSLIWIKDCMIKKTYMVTIGFKISPFKLFRIQLTSMHRNDIESYIQK